jgi:hypothetical protein
MPVAAPLRILPYDRAKLRRWARSAQLPAVLVQRARILLLAADGVTNTETAERVGVSRPRSSPAAAGMSAAGWTG